MWAALGIVLILVSWRTGPVYSGAGWLVVLGTTLIGIEIEFAKEILRSKKGES